MTVAGTIRQQVEVGTFMSLGAHEFAALTSEGREIGLTFKARILPFTKAGKRSPRPRIMRVTVELNNLDYYDVRVLYAARGQFITHYELGNIDAGQVSRILLALDYDGKEVLNTRVL
ncbi:hypothetical protein ACT3R3_14655 [Glutamicibacter sp. AOP5-B1-3]|uniref:hypothetical protein n=1 Tax=Glutamicibacter ardleyensis TaxID=225894 RepID=UPI003FD6909E